MFLLFFFFNDTATTEIYTLSLHDALPISTPTTPPWRCSSARAPTSSPPCWRRRLRWIRRGPARGTRTRDRKSTRLNLQSRQYLVCRLLLEKKKKNNNGQSQNGT